MIEMEIHEQECRFEDALTPLFIFHILLLLYMCLGTATYSKTSLRAEQNLSLNLRSIQRRPMPESTSRGPVQIGPGASEPEPRDLRLLPYPQPKNKTGNSKPISIDNLHRFFSCMDFKIKMITMGGKSMEVTIWDTAGTRDAWS